jgi:hypothetical protein
VNPALAYVANTSKTWRAGIYIFLYRFVDDFCEVAFRVGIHVITRGDGIGVIILAVATARGGVA